MDYKMTLHMTQDSAGSDNAKVKITINGVVVDAEQEITATDVTSAAAKHDYTVTGLDAPASDSDVTIKVELLNDYYVDADTDRNAYIYNIEYAYKQAAFDQWSLPVRWEPSDGATVVDKNIAHDFQSAVSGKQHVLSTFDNVTLVDGGDDQGDAWSAGDALVITSTYVEFTMPLTATYPTTKADGAPTIAYTDISNHTLLD